MNRSERRSGAVLSQQSANHVKAAVKHLKALLSSAGVDDHTEDDDGPDDQSAVSPPAVGGQDGTFGARGCGMPASYRVANRGGVEQRG